MTDLTMTVDGTRLWATLMELAKVGAYHDEATGLVAVNRQSLTDEDAAGRRLVIGWMKDAGLEVTIDELGNIFGRREGTDPGSAPVLVGSQIDSVATAGAFDGCLGVLGALEVVRSLDDAGIATPRPIVVAAWTEEEGVRFGTDMLGSAVEPENAPALIASLHAGKPLTVPTRPTIMAGLNCGTESRAANPFAESATQRPIRALFGG